MAMILTKPQTPEMIGLSAEQLAAITNAGGSLSLPDASIYIRFGGVQFPRPRHLLILWELWPSQAAAVARAGQCSRVEWLICPEPNVLAREVVNAAGKVIAPARVLPTFDHVMSLAETGGDTAEQSLDAIKRVAYQLARTWPDFEGAVEA